eukprot:7112538-Prymnesium_polylepis.1
MNETYRGNFVACAISWWNWTGSSRGAPSPASRKLELPMAPRATPPAPLYAALQSASRPMSSRATALAASARTHRGPGARAHSRARRAPSVRPAGSPAGRGQGLSPWTGTVAQAVPGGGGVVAASVYTLPVSLSWRIKPTGGWHGVHQ